MKPALRYGLLLGGLGLTAGAVFWASQLPSDDSSVVASASPNRTRSVTSRSVAGAQSVDQQMGGGLDLRRLQRERSETPNADLFGSRNFSPPPTPEQVKAHQRGQGTQQEAAAPPPPLPFTYIGQLDDGTYTMIFLAEGDRNLSVRKGDVIDDKYRVEDINENELVLVYLPQNARQTLQIGVAR